MPFVGEHSRNELGVGLDIGAVTKAVFEQLDEREETFVARRRKWGVNGIHDLALWGIALLLATAALIQTVLRVRRRAARSRDQYEADVRRGRAGEWLRNRYRPIVDWLPSFARPTTPADVGIALDDEDERGGKTGGRPSRRRRR